MAWINLRALVNRVGVVYDALKTHVIFAEDMNNIDNNLNYLKSAIEALPAVPTNTSDLNNDSGFINNVASLGDLIKSAQNYIDDITENDLLAITSAVHGGDISKITFGDLLEWSYMYTSGYIPASSMTFTNKRNKPRIVSATSYTTDTGTSLSVATADEFVITAQAGALKFNNPAGTPVQGEKLIIRIKDNGTARALTYDTQFRAMGTALPSTTVVSKTMYLGFIFNFTDTKWDLVAVAQEA